MNIQRNFRDHQLEENMKDGKANYLFKQLRLPKDLETIDIDNRNNIVNVLHQKILIFFVIGHQCFMKHLECTIQRHLNSDQFTSMSCTCQEDGWSIAIIRSLLSFLFLI